MQLGGPPIPAGRSSYRGPLPGSAGPGAGATIATLRLATSAIAKAHELAGHDSPCKERGVREALKGWGRRLARPQRQAGALTADVLAVMRLTAVRPRRRGRGIETSEQAADRARFDLALVAVLSAPDCVAARRLR